MGLIPDVMIRPETLHSWLTMGYGVDTFGYYRMVILDVDTPESYEDGHVPGAYLLAENSDDLWATRSNGIVDSPFQVPARARMDEIINRANIDSDSIVVITGSTITGISRAYFNFRYWGFPRQQLKVLSVTKAAFAEAGFGLQTTKPATPKPCGYSVCNLQPQSSVYKFRVSLQDMIQVAEDENPNTIIIDSRSAREYNGQPGSTPLDPQEENYVVFEGHIRTAVNQDYKTLLEPLSDVNLARSRDLLTVAMKKINLDSTMTSFIYNRTGLEAAVTFLVLDGVLNWPVKIYDGGWAQWGQMAGMDNATGGGLEQDSPWRTDIPGRSADIRYNKPLGYAIGSSGFYDSFAERADAINRQDSTVCGRAAQDNGVPPPAPGY